MPIPFVSTATVWPASLQVLLGVWIFVLGSAVGSFLNVVVYRLPRRMSLVWPGSHCPACKHPIRWHDNLPILGWIMLAGRCRDCHARISIRYPIVELISAALFLAMGLVEGFSLGANLPRRLPSGLEGTIGTTLDPIAASGILAYHLLLLGTLLPAALIESDGHRLPEAMFRPAALVGWLAPWVWPYLHPVPAWPGVPNWLAGAVDGAVGSIVGLALGEVIRARIGPRDRLGLLVGPGLVGLFLGWQAAAVLGLLLLPVHLVAQRIGRRWPAIGRSSPGWWLWATTLTWILNWHSLARWCPLLG